MFPAMAPWRSFWMAGFEGADHVNGADRALDMQRSNGHLERLNEDHARCAALGLRSVRESVGWRLAEPEPGRWDFERMLQIAHSARRHRLQVLWSLMHYGLPDDLSLFDEHMIERFAAFAGHAAALLAPLHDEPPVYTPINEIGFLAWAASASNLLYSPPGRPLPPPETSTISGYEVKRRLVRAALAAMQSIRRSDPRARFMHVEPLVHVVAPHGQPERQAEADQIAGYQWQVWDLLAGRLEPELGGHEAALDLIGINHYHSGQWEVGSERRLAWHLGDVRRRRPALLMLACWQRYGRPMIVAETSHIGAGRSDWLHHMAAEVAEARRLGAPVDGLCLYPAVDRPDWQNEAHWHHSGLFDVDSGPAIGAGHGTGMAHAVRPWQRLPNQDYLRALARWQPWLPNPIGGLPGSTVPARGLLLVLTRRRWRNEPGRLTRLMRELAGRWHVVVVEPPRPEALPAWIEHVAQGPRLDLLVPHSPLPGEAFDPAQCALLAPLLQQTLQALPQVVPGRTAALWLDCTAAQPLAHALAHALTPCALLDHPLQQDFPWLLPAVDAALHGQGPDSADSCEGRHVSALLAGIGVPRLVFAGSIDHRLDVALLVQLAQARQHWQLLLVGPDGKGAAELQLPPLPNLHRLPAQTEAVLPHLLSRCQLGMLPLQAIGSTQATGRAMSPHAPPQLLEYLASGLPVVSTPRPGLQPAVKTGLARVAEDGPGFVAACEAALAERGTQREQRRQAGLAEARRCSWSRAAARVDALLQAALRRAEVHAATHALDQAVLDATRDSATSRVALVAPPTRPDIGAGIQAGIQPGTQPGLLAEPPAGPGNTGSTSVSASGRNAAAGPL